MSFWNRWFGGDFVQNQGMPAEVRAPVEHLLNPATSLPMTDEGFGGVDIGGSPYGVDVHESFVDSSATSAGGDFETDGLS